MREQIASALIALRRVSRSRSIGEKYEGLVRFNEGKPIGGVVRRKKRREERRGDRNQIYEGE
jgi:hypothetical protein